MKRTLITAGVLCVAVCLCSSPALACFNTPTVVDQSAVPTMTPTPTPIPAELRESICASTASMRDDPLLMAEYAEVLGCLGWEDPRTAILWYPTCWAANWMTLRPMPCYAPRYQWEWIRTARIPARDCPQSPGAYCCTNFANRWCDCEEGGPLHIWCDCDGIYLTDSGSGPGPRRVAGTIEFCDDGPVIVVPEVNPGCVHDAWRHELIHLIRKAIGDSEWSSNESFVSPNQTNGWVCQ